MLAWKGVCSNPSSLWLRLTGNIFMNSTPISHLTMHLSAGLCLESITVATKIMRPSNWTWANAAHNNTLHIITHEYSTPYPESCIPCEYFMYKLILSVLWILFWVPPLICTCRNIWVLNIYTYNYVNWPHLHEFAINTVRIDLITSLVGLLLHLRASLPLISDWYTNEPSRHSFFLELKDNRTWTSHITFWVYTTHFTSLIVHRVLWHQDDKKMVQPKPHQPDQFCRPCHVNIKHINCVKFKV